MHTLWRQRMSITVTCELKLEQPVRAFRAYGSTEAEARIQYEPLSAAWREAVQVQDTLRLAQLVGLFRKANASAAQLDPLRRVQRGPWTDEAHSTPLPR